MDFIVRRGVYLAGRLGAARADWYAGTLRHLAALLDRGWLTICTAGRRVDLLTWLEQEALISWIDNVITIINKEFRS